MDETELIANSITKALAYTENGGKPDINHPVKGKTGELKSIYQFTPGTWKRYAKDILGDENAPLTADNETYVVREKVKKWVKKGHTVSQIASMWNAGEGEPDAYTGKFSTGKPSVGVNKKYGVKYDVPSYANKVLKYSKQFHGMESGDQATAQPSRQPEMTKLQPILSTIKQAQTPQPSIPQTSQGQV